MGRVKKHRVSRSELRETLMVLQQVDGDRKETAAALGITGGELQYRIRRLREDGAYIPSNPAQEGVGAYLPTPEQIRSECLQLQANWTPLERRQHCCYSSGDLEVEEIDFRKWVTPR